MPTTPDHKSSYLHYMDIQTRWNDNDVYGHINNAVYYTYFDTLVNTFLIENGLLTLGESDTIGLVVETQCQYFAPVTYPQTLEAGLRVGKLGTSSVRYEIGLFKAREDTAIAQGHFVHVYVSEQSRKPTPLAAHIRNTLQTLIPAP